MTGHGAKFGRKMEHAIAALLTRPSIEDAARLAGVGEKTLRRWMQQPQFNERYLRARREVVSQTVARMQQATGAAGITILKLMTDVNVTAAVRLRAAESVLNLAVKGIEIEDIERRLLELESAAEARPLGEWLISSKSGKRIARLEDAFASRQTDDEEYQVFKRISQMFPAEREQRLEELTAEIAKRRGT